MAADLHIHVFEGIDEEDLRVFFSNTLGSKRFSLEHTYPAGKRPPYVPLYEGDVDRGNDWDLAYSRVQNTPNIHVGEVSWLKAAMIEGGEEQFIPDTVAVIHEAIGEELPVLDAQLRERILTAFLLPNRTSYNVEDRAKIARFLTAHQGKRLFTVSW